MPTVSIVIPMYNAKNTIARAIDSVLSQSYENYEVIVVNDGSTDNTEEIVNNKFNDNRIKYFYKDNGGVSSARNFGITKANGKCILFLDSDDYYKDEFAVDNYLKNTTENTVYVCKLSSINVKTNSFKTENNEESIEHLMSNALFNSPCNKCYSRDIIVNNNISFDESVNLGEDLIFNSNYFKYIDNINYEDEVRYIVDRSQNPSSLTQSYNDKYFEMWERVESALNDLYNYRSFNKDNNFYFKLFRELMSIVLVPLVTRSGYDSLQIEAKIKEHTLNPKIREVIKLTKPDASYRFLTLALIALKNKWIKFFIHLVRRRHG